MHSRWHHSLYFDPKNNLKPLMIDEYGNTIPYKEYSKFILFEEMVRFSSIVLDKNPFIIFNGTHTINNLDKLLEIKKYRKILKKNKTSFYFGEPLTFYNCKKIYRNNKIPHIYHPEEHEKTSDIRSLELDSIEDWVEKNNFKIKVFCTDYNSHIHFKKIYKNLEFGCLDTLVESTSEILYRKNKLLKINEKNIQKKFWCGAWRYDIIRHMTIAYLASQNLTLNNHVSFFFKISNNEFKRRLWIGWNEFALRHSDTSKKLLEGNLLLQNQVPLSIEINDPIFLTKNDSDPEADTAGKNIRKNHNPQNSYRESFCAIVLESRYAQPWPNISEKTLNAIENGRPFIIVGPSGTLKMLKEMGFRTFNQWWDESYDNIENNIDRFVNICEVIDYINSFSLEELKIKYSEMIPILTHNIRNFKKVKKFYQDLNKDLNKKSAQSE